MQAKNMQQCLLAALIFSIPATGNAADYLKNPAIAATTAGIACFLAGGTLFWKIGNNNSTAKYAFKEQQAQRAEEQRKEREANEQRRARINSAKRERITIEHAQRFLEPFQDLLKQCHSSENGKAFLDAVQNDAVFQNMLITRACASTNNAECVTHIGQQGADLTKELEKIENTEFAIEVAHLKRDIQIVQHLLNSSRKLHDIERDLTLEKYTVIRVQAEANESRYNEEAARTRLQAATELKQIAEDLPALLHRVEGNVSRISREGYAEINSYLARQNSLMEQDAQDRRKQHKTLKRITDQQPILAIALNAVAQEFPKQLLRIENKADQTETSLARLIDRTVQGQENQHSVIKQMMQTLYQTEQRIRQEIATLAECLAKPQPSAPPAEAKYMSPTGRPQDEL